MRRYWTMKGRRKVRVIFFESQCPHWSFFLRVQLTINQHYQVMAWRRTGDKPYLKQYWPISPTHVYSTRGNELNHDGKTVGDVGSCGWKSIPGHTIATNFAHATAAELSCRLQNLTANTLSEFWWGHFCVVPRSYVKSMSKADCLFDIMWLVNDKLFHPHCDVITIIPSPLSRNQ